MASLGKLLPADAVLLGEQHDAQDHQRWHHDAVQALASRGALAALALEMAEQGTSTAGLPRDASACTASWCQRWWSCASCCSPSSTTSAGSSLPNEAIGEEAQADSSRQMAGRSRRMRRY